MCNSLLFIQLITWQYGGHSLSGGADSSQKMHVCLHLGLTDYRFSLSLSLRTYFAWPKQLIYIEVGDIKMFVTQYFLFDEINLHSMKHRLNELGFFSRFQFSLLFRLDWKLVSGNMVNYLRVSYLFFCLISNWSFSEFKVLCLALSEAWRKLLNLWSD